MSSDAVPADGSNSPAKGNQSKRSRSEPSTEEEYLDAVAADGSNSPAKGNYSKSRSEPSTEEEYLDAVAADGSNSPAKGKHSKRSRSEPSIEEEYLASCQGDLRCRVIENSQKLVSDFVSTVDDALEPEFESEPANKKQAVILEQSEDNISNNFKCSVCCKEFPTHKSLDLHKKIHRDKPIRINPSGEDNNNNINNKTHHCLICGKCFQKGQSLGGHMRCHYKRPIRIRDSCRRKYQDFDLNISPARESELESDSKPEPALNLELTL